MDYLPDKMDEISPYFQEWHKIRSLIWKTTRTYNNIDKQRTISKIKYYLKKLVFPSREKVIGLHYNFCKKISEDVANSLWTVANNKFIVMPINTFSNLEILPFESYHFCCTHLYDLFLTQMYGNYMELPPVEERHPPHDVEYFQVI